MIVRLAGSTARIVFSAALLAALATGVLLVLSFRLLRAATVGGRPRRREEAAFATLAAVVALAKTLKEETDARA